jgi:hypothetical protein
MASRTENALKNRFNLLLCGQRKTSGNLTEKRLVRLCLSRLMLEEGQQEQLEMPTPIQPTEIEQLPELASASMEPIVPTVAHRQVDLGFQLCYDGLMGYLSNAQLPTYCIGFVFPTHF